MSSKTRFSQENIRKSSQTPSPPKKPSQGSSPPRSGSPTSISRVTSYVPIVDEDGTKPDFIYGGPFIKVDKPSPFLNTACPVNIQLQGTFKKSFAYYSLKERLPVILTKIIDYLSREGGKVQSATGATVADTQALIAYISKLKNELMTNKKYELLKVDTPDAAKWNEWIQGLNDSCYFTNVWVWSECYVYRRLREGCELSGKLINFDPFEHQKMEALSGALEAMCVVAERAAAMLPASDKDKRKADFVTLLKICLWANKCDLSLSLGECVSPKAPTEAKPVDSAKEKGDKIKPVPSTAQVGGVFDPFQMIVDLKDKLLVDDTSKIADQVQTKADNIRKAIEGNTTFKFQCSCHRLATLAGVPVCKNEQGSAKASITTLEGKGKKGDSGPPAVPPEENEGAPKVPCPAKMVLPHVAMFDIVCDNAGYELFADLCLATFLVSQNIVQKVRFHVKKMPWFVSDVTPKDFKYMIDACAKANFSKTLPVDPKSAPSEEGPAEPPRVVDAAPLRRLAELWAHYVDNGTFVVLSDEFWTYPHTYKDMKKYDPDMYRKLQYATAVLFKGDLNYRKLLGERNCNPTLGFEAALQGFMPAPVIAVRTVKADLICGLPKGKWEQLNKLDEKWMEKGDYGVIQFCAKSEPLKTSDRPCPYYGDTCRGVTCPVDVLMAPPAQSS